MNDSLSWSPARHPPSRRPTSPSPSPCTSSPSPSSYPPPLLCLHCPYCSLLFLFTAFIALFFSVPPLSPSLSLYHPCHPFFHFTALVALFFSSSPSLSLLPSSPSFSSSSPSSRPPPLPPHHPPLSPYRFPLYSRRAPSAADVCLESPNSAERSGWPDDGRYCTG